MVSANPSRWIPPVTSTGISVMTAAKKRLPQSVQVRSAYPAAYSRAPVTTPATGKKHIAYFIFFSFQSTVGTGIFEYMDNATAREPKNRIFLLPPFL